MKLESLFVAFFLLTAEAQAQSFHVNDSLTTLNKQRIKTNATGMKVLGTWGIANIAAGGVGYFTAKTDDWKYFHEMNFFWGLINTGIAGAGFAGTRKEMKEQLSCGDMLHRYEATKRLYLVNMGLDVLYIGAGAYLSEHAKNANDNPALYTGFGRSVILQGIGLLVFDNIMYAAHRHNDKKWYKLLEGLCISGSGVGVRYELK